MLAHLYKVSAMPGKTIAMELIGDKKVLVVGGGGREHAIVDALSHSLHVSKIFCAPGNAGIAAQAECVPIKDTEIEKLRDFAMSEHIDLTVVGPEVPLSEGITDVFEAAGLRVFGPSAAAARIESSKDFAKQLMAKYHVPTATYRTFEDYDEALEYVKTGSFPVVLKYDGLAAGKGVVIPVNLDEAKASLKDMLLDDKFGKGKVVVEEFLTGPEFSYMCFVDGLSVWPLAVAQDHKRAYEGDKGPNTGGMGAYSPVPLITAADEAFALEHIMKPVAAAMVAEGCPFKGLLYGGLMKTPEGVKVIEFNCRFGDPETEVVLPRLKSDIYEIFDRIAGVGLAAAIAGSGGSEEVGNAASDGSDTGDTRSGSKTACGAVTASVGSDTGDTRSGSKTACGAVTASVEAGLGAGASGSVLDSSSAAGASGGASASDSSLDSGAGAEVAGSLASCSGDAHSESADIGLEWRDEAVIGFVLASRGYPGSYEKGFEITGVEEALADPDVRIYHMGTKLVASAAGASGGVSASDSSLDSGAVASGSVSDSSSAAGASGGAGTGTTFSGEACPKLVTAGGRVMMVLARGADLAAARVKALKAVGKIHCPNLFFRRDIGWRVIDNKVFDKGL